MSVPADWVWGRLSPAHLYLAATVAKEQLRVCVERNLEQTRGTHPNGELWQKRVGAEGEIAFQVIRDRPLPTIREMTSSWHGPDSGKWSVKAITGRNYNLIFRNADLVPGVDAFVVIYNAAPDVAIVGWLPVEVAVAAMRWGYWMPRPCWTVQQALLYPWKDARCS